MKRWWVFAAVLLALPVSAQETFTFATCEDSSGNDRHGQCIGELDSVNSDSATSTKYGGGATGWSVTDFFWRPTPTEVWDNTSDFTVFVVSDITGAPSVVVSHSGTVAGSPQINWQVQTANSPPRYEFRSATNVLDDCDLALGSPALDVNYNRAWFRYNASTFRIDGKGYRGDSDFTVTCQDQRTQEIRDDDGNLTIGCSNADGATCVSATQASMGIMEVRLWNRWVPTATLDAIADQESSFCRQTPCSGERAFYQLENVTITIQPPAPEPSELSQGLLDFMGLIGFASPESQFLFALILIGLAMVIADVSLRRMAPSKLKNSLIMGVGWLVAVVAVVLGMFDLWQMTIATILAFGVMWGVHALVNTLRDTEAFAKEAFGGSAPTGESESGDAEPAVSSLEVGTGALGIPAKTTLSPGREE